MMNTQTNYTLHQVCEVLDDVAPPERAQSWDNVGLLAGDPAVSVREVMACLDLTPEVVEEAIAARVDLIVAYHPPIFKPLTRLRADSPETDAAVFRCVAAGVAIYSTHTALDAADGGTNDVLAHACGIETTEPIDYVDPQKEKPFKLVTFVPPDHLERLADALTQAGAGRIGDYTHCSFRVVGQGTFLGGPSTNPAVGQAGRLEKVDEIRLEMAVPGSRLPEAVAALRQAHGYEEPAFDLYPLRAAPVRGIGRVGRLPQALPLEQLAKTLKTFCEAPCVQLVGDPAQPVERAVILVGSAGTLPLKVARPGDVIITGEIRHHDALTMSRRGILAVALGHGASERPALKVLVRRVSDALPGLSCRLSQADVDPFQPV